MTAPDSIDPVGWLADQLASASPDLLRNLVKTFADAVMSAEADQLCGADYGTRSPTAATPATATAPGLGHPHRDRGTGDPETPILLVFPGMAAATPPPRRTSPGHRGHRGRHQLPARCLHAARGETGRATRREGLSKSQVSDMAGHLDAQVKAFQERPLDAGPYTFVAMDTLTIKVGEDGRIVNVHALIATEVNNDGHRESWSRDRPRPKTAPAGWRSCAAW